jgi:hypothetical protein
MPEKIIICDINDGIVQCEPSNILNTDYNLDINKTTNYVDAVIFPKNNTPYHTNNISNLNKNADKLCNKKNNRESSFCMKYKKKKNNKEKIEESEFVKICKKVKLGASNDFKQFCKRLRKTIKWKKNNRSTQKRKSYGLYDDANTRKMRKTQKQLQRNKRAQQKRRKENQKKLGRMGTVAFRGGGSKHTRGYIANKRLHKFEKQIRNKTKKIRRKRKKL